MEGHPKHLILYIMRWDAFGFPFQTDLCTDNIEFIKLNQGSSYKTILFLYKVNKNKLAVYPVYPV